MLACGSCALTFALAAACTGDDPVLLLGQDGAAPGEDGAAPPDGASVPDGAQPVVDAGPRAVRCGSTVCTGTQICCNAHTPDAGCTEPAACASVVGRIACDDRADCAPNQLCCTSSITEDPNDAGSRVFLSSGCQATGNLGCAEATMCTTPDDCAPGQTACLPSAPEYYPTVTLCN